MRKISYSRRLKERLTIIIIPSTYNIAIHEILNYQRFLWKESLSKDAEFSFRFSVGLKLGAIIRLAKEFFFRRK